MGIGTHRELLEKCPIYYDIAASQLSKEELARNSISSLKRLMHYINPYKKSFIIVLILAVATLNFRDVDAVSNWTADNGGPAKISHRVNLSILIMSFSG